MASAINTGRVAERRRLHFNGLDDVLAEVELLAKSKEIRTLGNWSAGQVLKHLAVVMDKSVDGFVYRVPAVVRLLARLLVKRRFLTRPMAAGFKLPPNATAELGPPETTLEEGLRAIRHAIGRLRSETRRAAHPVFGTLTADEWERLHCRHAELHLSFLVPTD